MGLFDKRDKGRKKKDDFDSPVESIDLSAPVAPVAKRAAAYEDPRPRPQPKLQPQQPVRPEPPSYGIEKAIELMRSLPADNLELVVQTVKLALESTGVKISSIIADAGKRQEQIQHRIAELKAAVADLEKQISTRTKEIARLEGDHKETTSVKERLTLAESLSAANKPEPKPAANKSDAPAKAKTDAKKDNKKDASRTVPTGPPPARSTADQHTVRAQPKPVGTATAPQTTVAAKK